MIKHYLKSAWRTMVKDRTYALINIFGLTIGLVACMLVGNIVLDDLSYDNSWEHRDEVYRIVSVETDAGLESKNASTYANLGHAFKDNFPEVLAVSSVSPNFELNLRMEKTDDETIQMDIVRADTNVWELLDFQILAGNPYGYAAGVGNLVISEAFRDEHFPNENPVGKTVYSVDTYREEITLFQITAVMANLPNNSYLRADGLHIIRPHTFELSKAGGGVYDEQLIRVKPGTDMSAFAEKANRWYNEFLTEVPENRRNNMTAHEFQPIKDIYLHSDFAFQRVKGNLNNIYIFSIVTVLLLVIACINFINLSTARAVRRLRETGVRKVMGATRGQLAMQFLSESLLFFGVSTIMAFGLYALSCPWLELFMGYELTVNLLSSLWLFVLLGVIFLISVLTGTYPAYMMSGFKIGNALRGRLGHSSVLSAFGIRKILVVVQFSIAILVLIGMITVWKQVHYMEDKPLGFTATNVLAINGFTTEGKGETLRNELSQSPGVEQVSLSVWVPTQGSGGFSRRMPNPGQEGEYMEIHYISADTDMPALLGFDLESGRLFDERERGSIFSLDMMYSSDTEEEKLKTAQLAKSLVTASTAKIFGLTDADFGVPHMKLGVTPVGIIRDFHSISLHDPIKPMVILAEENLRAASVLVKIRLGQERLVMNTIHATWKDLYPNKPLQLNWVDDLIQKQYEKEIKQGQLFSFFSVLMLFLSALGMFGLIVHTTEQRIKEIGIRKVLGASVANITTMLSKDFVKLVCLAIVIASPIAWWAMNKWLEDFAYRIDVEWWMFAVAGLLAVLVALVTVSWQAVRAAIANPVESLRDE